MLLTAIVFIAILSLLVLIHELGHFLAAKKMGILVEELGFGLPITPRIFGKKIGETIYSIYPLPFGGFVKLHGEDFDDKDKKNLDSKRSFFLRSKRQRLIVLTAGVIMNVILAMAIFYPYLIISNFKTEMPLFLDHKFFAVNQQNRFEIIISEVAPNSPAEKAGIKKLSKVVSINTQKLASGQDFSSTIDRNKGKTIKIELQDLSTSEIYTTEVTPRVSPPKNEGPLGIGFGPIETAVLSYETPLQKIFSGATYPFNLLAYNLNIVGNLIAVSFKEKTAAPVGEVVSGPIAIAGFVGDVLRIPNVKERVLQLLNLVGLISISLAFLNILPFPALDGGRVFFIGIETVLGRRVKPKIEAVINQIGFALLIVLMTLVGFNDLQRVNFWEKLKNLIP